MFSTSTSTSASTNVRREFNRLFLVESGITEDEFAELMAYITNNPNKIPDIEESLKYGTDSFKVKYSDFHNYCTTSFKIFKSLYLITK
ncbi:unnamed protein product [Rhizophagus irregularis]|nr:unnamed protein product [Rhizophagus irregularis]